MYAWRGFVLLVCCKENMTTVTSVQDRGGEDNYLCPGQDESVLRLRRVCAAESPDIASGLACVSRTDCFMIMSGHLILINPLIVEGLITA